MKRIVLLLFSLIFAVFGLVGCSKYSFHYNAVGHVYSGEEVDSCYDYLPEDTVYIIIETSEKCQNGDFAFEIFYG